MTVVAARPVGRHAGFPPPPPPDRAITLANPVRNGRAPALVSCRPTEVGLCGAAAGSAGNPRVAPTREGP